MIKKYRYLEIKFKILRDTKISAVDSHRRLLWIMHYSKVIQLARRKNDIFLKDLYIPFR